MPRNTDTSAATKWHIEQRIKRQLDYEKNPTRCQRCDKPFPYGTDKRKKYCGHSCAAVNNNARGRYIPKPCQQCGELTKNIFCTKKCQSIYNKQKIITRWLSGDIISESEDMPILLRQYMLSEAKNQCSE